MRRWLRWGVAVLAVALFGAAVFFRMMPSSLEGIHVRSYPSGIGHQPQWNAHAWREIQMGDGRAQMQALDAIMRATPRTKWVAGSVEEGVLSYITRSRVFGFPDVTSIWRDVALIESDARAIEITSRALYGTSDLGVNRDRIERWLAQLRR